MFIDNSGHVKENIGSHDNGTEFPVSNKGQVISYRAVDAAGNEVFCNFTVAVKGRKSHWFKQQIFCCKCTFNTQST